MASFSILNVCLNFIQTVKALRKLLSMLHTLCQQTSYDIHTIYPHAVLTVERIQAETMHQILGERVSIVEGDHVFTPFKTRVPHAVVGDFTHHWGDSSKYAVL